MKNKLRKSNIISIGVLEIIVEKMVATEKFKYNWRIFYNKNQSTIQRYLIQNKNLKHKFALSKIRIKLKNTKFKKKS